MPTRRRRRLAQPVNAALAIEWLRHVDRCGCVVRARNLASRALRDLCGILDPRTGGFVYVGQSGSFAMRIASHLSGEAGAAAPSLPSDPGLIGDAVEAGTFLGSGCSTSRDTKEQSLRVGSPVGRMAGFGRPQPPNRPVTGVVRRPPTSSTPSRDSGAQIAADRNARQRRHHARLRPGSGWRRFRG